MSVAVALCFLVSSISLIAESPRPTHPVDSAKAAIKARKDSDALPLLQDFVQTSPNAPEATEARFLIGQIQARQRQHDEALRSFAWIISSSRGAEWAEKALEETAKIHELRRNLTGAQQARDTLLRDYPSSATTARAWSTIADRHYQAGQFKEANAIYEKIAPRLKGAAIQRHESAKAIVDSGGDPGKLLAAANLALKSNHRDLAKNLFYLVAEKKPTPSISYEARVKYAWCLYLEGKTESIEAAEKIWEAIAAQDPKGEWGGASRWHLVQLSAGPKGEWKKAVDMCAAIAHDFSPGSFRHEQALFTRAWLLRTHKEWSDAKTAFAEMIEFYPAKANHPPIISYIEEIETGLSNPDRASN